ncbi:MAG: alpha/beta fold hydrolase [Acidimicrobiia bacterium]
MTARGGATSGFVLAMVLSVAIAAGTATGAGAARRADSAKTPAPNGLPKFYAVPNLPDAPGEIIKSQKLEIKGLGGTMYRVMYTSTNLRDEVIPVTGLIVVPKGEAPSGGFPVLSIAHGTTGMADECAPSLTTESGPETNALLDAGYLVVATDYEGLGTPGLHPYIAGENAARNTVDIVRAAVGFKPANAGSDYVVWGHSQGGHTAMHALIEATGYAADVELHGVVAGAPPSQFALLYNFLKTSDFRHYLLMAGGGLNAAYGDEAAPLDAVLTERGIELLAELENGCSGYLQKLAGDIPYEEVGDVDPYTVPEWRALLQADDPQSFESPGDVPLLIIHGGNDEQIPVASSALLTDHLCDIGQALERWVYPGNMHAEVIGPSFADMIGWIDARFAGESGPYEPTGQPDIEARVCGV